MKKRNFKLTLLSLTIGLVMMLSAIPTALGQFLAPAKASEVKNAYSKPTTVDVKGTFEENGLNNTPTGWKVEAEYDKGENKDSTSYNGILQANPIDWETTYNTWEENFLKDWVKNHEFDTTLNSVSSINDIKTAIANDLTPWKHILYKDFETNPSSNSILALMAGKTYTQYLNSSNNTVSLTNEARTTYSKFTSNEFILDQYSFYKITVDFKTTNSGKASIVFDGDIEESFIDLQSPSAVHTIYYYYTLNDGSTNKTVFNITAPGAANLTHDGKTYTYNGNPDDVKYTYTEMVGETEKTYTLIPQYTGEPKAPKYITSDTSAWQTYTIYLSTTTEAKVSLALGLGNKEGKSGGNAFFDNVKVEKIQLLDFFNNAESNTYSSIIDKREILSSNQNNANSRNYTVIENFEDTSASPLSWRVDGSDIDLTDLYPVNESGVTGFNETFPKKPTLDDSNSILKIHNQNTKDVSVKTNKIDLERMKYYRISFWATSTTSSNNSSKLTVEFIGTKADNTTSTTKDSTSPYISSRTNSEPSNINNFWVNYIFYVKAPAEVDTTAEIKLTISSNATIYFDNLVIETVSKAEYTATKNNKQDLSTTFKDQILTNGNFYEFDSVEEEYYSTPLPPAGWTNIQEKDVYEYYNDSTSEKFTTAYFKEDLTFSADEKTITLSDKNFVKAEDSDNFNYKENGKIKERIQLVKDVKFNYKASEEAYTNDAYEIEIETSVVAGIEKGTEKVSNILSINATNSESTTYKSSVMKLSSTASVYIIRADVRTDSSAYINLRLVDKDDKVYASLNNLNPTDWKTYTFYVGTGLETIELYFEIEYKDSTGKAEIKKIEAIKTSTTSIMDSKLKMTHNELTEKGIAVVNLQKETFIEHSNELNNTSHLFDTNLYTLKEIDGKTSGIYGVLDTLDSARDHFKDISAYDSEISPYVLVIQNEGIKSTQLEAVKKFTVAKSKYLKITIVARAEGLTAGKSATISFGDLNKTFNINTSEYTEFVLYVDNSNSDKATAVNYAISLLDSAGTVVVDSISIESPSSISSVKSEYPDGDTDTVKFATVGEPDDKKDEKEKEEALELEDEDKTLEIFFAVFASLLLVASIVFAIAFTRYKALHKPRKKSEKSKVKETDDGQKGFI